MRVAMIAGMLCAAGCRQLLGIDSPSLVGDQADAPASDGPADGIVHAGDAAGGAMFVGGANGDGTGSASGSLTGAAAGDVLVVGVLWSGNSTATVSDTDGNTYNLLDELGTGNPLELEVYYAVAASPNGATDSISATLSISQPVALVVADYRGIDSSDPIDGDIGATGSGTVALSSPLLTTNANDIVVATAGAAKVLTAVPPFTKRVHSLLGYLLLEDRNVDATGSYQASVSLATSGTWCVDLLALRAAP
ncbi:MAG TPA: hypothetical protein VMJ10_22180 [Kofleriaceae bacterium]|nr:hypothetical protein [Kofleriaceae bacterium]